MKWLALLLLLGFGFARPADEAFDSFVHQVLADVGFSTSECPKMASRFKSKAVCTTTPIDFVGFRQRWDTVAKAHEAIYGIESYKTWNLRKDGTYNRTYTLSSGAGVLTVYYSPLKSGMYFFVAVWHLDA